MSNFTSKPKKLKKKENGKKEEKVNNRISNCQNAIFFKKNAIKLQKKIQNTQFITPCAPALLNELRIENFWQKNKMIDFPQGK